MARRLEGKLVVATHNPGKFAELRELLTPYGIEVLSAADLGLPEPEETGTSFSANAILKARAAAQSANMPALADDSGLCVDALQGAPGVHSARWAGEARDFSAAMKKVERAVQAATANVRPKAHFACVLALAFPDGEVETFEGKVLGELVFPPRGNLGFGYDPIFLPENSSRTFGEMTGQEKHGIPAGGSEGLSHRARAFQAFAEAFLAAHCRRA
jgi:XTP/dITP diphosphohydrolase